MHIQYNLKPFADVEKPKVNKYVQSDICVTMVISMTVELS
jgi:hypothetical protein